MCTLFSIACGDWSFDLWFYVLDYDQTSRKVTFWSSHGEKFGFFLSFHHFEKIVLPPNTRSDLCFLFFQSTSVSQLNTPLNFHWYLTVFTTTSI